MKIVVLMGGDSTEREVSLVSGDQITQALLEIGHEVIKIDPSATKKEQTELNQTDQHWIGIDYPDFETLPLHRGSMYAKNILIVKRLNVDVVFNALHGGKGENGIIQGMLDAAEIPYTGSGRIASMLSMEKDLSKQFFRMNHLPTPAGLVLESKNNLMKNSLKKLKFPQVVKPSNQGSTIGLHIINEYTELEAAVEDSFRYGPKVIVEEYIAGREITVTILKEKAYPIVEIVPKHGLYDYECKYSSGMSEYIVPAAIGKKLTQKIQEIALKAHQILGCQGYSRADLRLSTDNHPYILEVNTLPGMTGTSLVPKSVKAAGIKFTELIELILEAALNKPKIYA